MVLGWQKPGGKLHYFKAQNTGRKKLDTVTALPQIPNG